MISRRDVLRGGLAAAGMAVLAACGISPKRKTAALTALPKQTGKLSVANWPLYIDVDPKTKRRPTIDSFEKATHIKVTYREVIDDNDPFFGTIREPLARGESTGWDVIVVTDWLVGRMQRLGYLEELHPEKLPLVTKNEGKIFQMSGPLFSVPWQAGITGIGYNPKQTHREITSFGDLFDPAFKGKVGMLSDMRDMFHLTLLWMGVNPNDATHADLVKARDKLVAQRKAGLVRGYYQNDYTDALARGDLSLCLAYSGDIFQLQSSNPDLKFVVPKEGGMLFVDEMCIPKGAADPTDAHEWMNFVYRPDIAANITTAVEYITPVPSTKSIIEEREKHATGDDRATLEQIASSPLVYPTASMSKRLHRYRILSESEESEWNGLFSAVVQS